MEQAIRTAIDAVISAYCTDIVNFVKENHNAETSLIVQKIKSDLKLTPPAPMMPSALGGGAMPGGFGTVLHAPTGTGTGAKTGKKADLFASSTHEPGRCGYFSGRGKISGMCCNDPTIINAGCAPGDERCAACAKKTGGKKKATTSTSGIINTISGFTIPTNGLSSLGSQPGLMAPSFSTTNSLSIPSQMSLQAQPLKLLSELQPATQLSAPSSFSTKLSTPPSLNQISVPPSLLTTPPSLSQINVPPSLSQINVPPPLPIQNAEEEKKPDLFLVEGQENILGCIQMPRVLFFKTNQIPIPVCVGLMDTDVKQGEPLVANYPEHLSPVEAGSSTAAFLHKYEFPYAFKAEGNIQQF